MKKVNYVLYLMLLVILLPNCVIAQRKISNDIVKFDENSNKGLIVGSITFREVNARFNSYSPKITSLTDGKSSEFFIQPNGIMKLKHWGELQDGRTYLFAITKPPGKYEINTIRFSNVSSFKGIVIDHKSSQFSIPFEVNKGQIIYIGEIDIDEYASKKDTLIRLKDEFERDLNRMKRKDFKKINWDQTKKSDFKIIYN